MTTSREAQIGRTPSGLHKRTLLTLLLIVSPIAEAADCLDEAAHYQGLNPLVLRAIAYHESRMRADAVNHNSNQTSDLGLMGINTVHTRDLARHGINRDMLLDPCVNAYVGAWLLRRKIDKYGTTWKAVAAYHSETPEIGLAYMRRIQEILRKWNALPASRTGTPPP